MGSFLGGGWSLLLFAVVISTGESQAKPAVLRAKIKSRIEAYIVIKPPVIPTRRILSAWLPERLLGRTEIAKDTPAIRLARPRNCVFRAGQSAMIRISGGRMINRIKTSWLAEFISIAFLFVTTLLVVTVSDIGKERKAKKARTGSPESHNGAEQ
jgi:hypothetical protein